jgi:uncharacterized protein YecT (DUF1311 family)
VRNSRNKVLGAFLLISLVVESWAAGATIEDICQQAQNQRELTSCWSQAAKDAEKSLTDTYEKAVVQLRTRNANGALVLLKGAQVKWESYRDAQCATVSKLYEGGSAEGMQRDGCRARLANQRKGDLDSMLADWGTEAKGTQN